MKLIQKYLFNGHFVTISTGIVFTIPILFLGISLKSFDIVLWRHLSEFVLPEAFLMTSALLLIVTTLSLILGSSLAYLNTFYNYSGKFYFKIFNILPMSLPPYIMSFVYLALFDVTGIFSLWIKDFLKLSFFFPSIRNVYGLGFVLSLCLTPYVYLMAKQAFQTNGTFCYEVGSSIGLSKKKIFFKLLMPLSAPALISSIIIVSMEVLADFGAVSLFNVNTFSTIIYRSWFGLQSLDSAKKISLILISVVFLLMLLKWLTEKQKSTLILSKQIKPIKCSNLIGTINILATIFQSIYVFFAFILPMCALIFWSVKSWKIEFDFRYFSYIGHSLNFAIYTALSLFSICSFISFQERKNKNNLSTFFKNLASLGYAIPGTVLSVSLFVMLRSIEISFLSDKRIITTSIFGLILGLSIRFFSVAYVPLEQALNQLLESNLQYLKITKISFLKKLTRIYFPYLKPGAITASLFVIVEVIKEIPMTLMMRPFGHETLATRIFELTSEGEWQRAALPSLFLMSICLISSFFIIYREHKNESK